MTTKISIDQARKGSEKTAYNYVFAVFFQSCTNPGEWVRRTTVKQSNECKSNPWQLAGNIASHYMRVDETGVKVQYLGIETSDGLGTAEGLVISQFTVTLIRGLS